MISNESQRGWDPLFENRSSISFILVQCCPTLSPFATRGDKSLKCGNRKFFSRSFFTVKISAQLLFYIIFTYIVARAKTLSPANVVTRKFWLDNADLVDKTKSKGDCKVASKFLLKDKCSSVWSMEQIFRCKRLNWVFKTIYLKSNFKSILEQQQHHQQKWNNNNIIIRNINLNLKIHININNKY